MNHDQYDQDEKSNVERRQDLRQEEEGFRLHQEEKQLRVAKRDNTFLWITKSIYWPISILEILLLVRFLLRLFGGNTENGFSQLIYNLSNPFMTPFSTLFVSPTSEGAVNIFDVNIVIAMIVYALLSYLLVSLLKFIFYHDA